jgi:hypothetical protein
MKDIARVVALGASNLTRGFPTIVAQARAAWGPEIQILAALGRGRSYGASSWMLFRTLPGILESGVWRTLDSLPPVPTRALIADAGNDLLRGYSVEQMLAWVEEALVRLQRVTRDIIITDLPLTSIQRLSRAKYLILRSILFPPSRLSLAQIQEMVKRTNEGIETLSNAYGAKMFNLNPNWYGVDPIHIRHSFRQRAWQQILGVPAMTIPVKSSLKERLGLSLMPPERRKIFGIEQLTPQSGAMLPIGGRVWLY